MTAEADKQQNDPDDDNLFADPEPVNRNQKQRPSRNDDLFGIDDEPQGNRFEDLGIFQQESGSNYKDEKIAKDLQEKEDAEIAYRLQREYLKQEQVMEQQLRAQQQSQQRSRNHPQQNSGMNAGGPGWDFSQPANNNQQQSYSQNQQSVRQEGMPNQGSGSKKKTGFMSKMKAGINNLFGKKKKNKEGALNPGTYAEIDNLEEQEVYNFSNPDPQSRNTGLHQLDNFNQHHQGEQNDDAPMQLSDVLNGRGGGHDSEEEENNDNPYPSFNNNNNNPNRNATVSNEHFGF